MRLIARFEKTGAARFMSHLDLQRAVQRLLRRSGLPVRYTEGFNPHTVLSFAAPLPVGTASAYEVMDFELVEEWGSDVLAAMNAAAPLGMRALEVREVSPRFPSPMAAAVWADYEVRVLESADALRGVIAEVISAAEVVVDKRSKSGVKPVDIRLMIASLRARDGALHMRLAASQACTLRPELVVGALASRAAVGVPPFEAMRVCLLGEAGGETVPLMMLPDPARP